jgi:hypothetical protein
VESFPARVTTVSRSEEKREPPGQPGTPEEDVECIRLSCQRSSKKSAAHLTFQLGVPTTTIQNVLHKTLRLRTYEIQTVHEVRNTDQCTRAEFANLMLNATGDDETVLGE